MAKEKKERAPILASKKVKIIILLCMAVIAFFAGKEFWELRHYKEVFVASDELTEIKWLSDYLPELKDSWFDTPIYVFDSGVEGGSVFIMGNVHPYEPASSITCYVMLENIHVECGKVFIMPQGNYSGSTMGSTGGAYPKFVTVQTEWGEQKYRIGARESNPLDQWPDPFTYVHYPSGQNLAYQDIRNMNRTYPGRADGTPTEMASYAIMELLRKEKIDIAIDIHEASIMYPVVGTYVAPDKSLSIAGYAAMSLSEYFNMKFEASPKSLRGLSHREWGDYSQALPFLMETPEPFIDRITGPITEEFMLEGKDEFLAKAAEKGLTYVPYKIEEGQPMWYRVGRHLSGAAEAIAWTSYFYPDIVVEVEWPLFEDIQANGLGYYLHDPDAPENASKVQVVYHKPAAYDRSYQDLEAAFKQ